MVPRTPTLSAMLLLWVGLCNGHATGADDEACKDLYPSHGYKAKSAAEGYAEGYRLVQDKVDYKPNDIITVTLYTVGPPFKALPDQGLRRGRKRRGSVRAARSPLQVDAQLLRGHAHAPRRQNRTSGLTWRAPKDRRGKVHFKATVLKTFNNFYHAMPKHTSRKKHDEEPDTDASAPVTYRQIKSNIIQTRGFCLNKGSISCFVYMLII
uniref:Putative secreted protein n=2 Tax=Ixodes ricinus TaxID=34613 RepID=A0A090X821_IXORI